MSLNVKKHRIYKGLVVEGIKYDVYYNPNDGQVQLKTPIVGGQGGRKTGGVVVYDSNKDQNSSVEDAIKNNEIILKRINKARTDNKDKGKLPNFVTGKDVNKATADSIGKRIAEEFQTTDQDYYFGAKKAAQYPVDAIYNK